MKRKLKDLKENECIKVNTLAQAKYFIEKLNFSVMPNVLVGKVIVEGGVNKFYWNDDENTRADLERVPASDFIKPKRSGMKKEIEKLRKTCKELAETQKKTNEYLEVLNGENGIENNASISKKLVFTNKCDYNPFESKPIEVADLPNMKDGFWYKNSNIDSLFLYKSSGYTHGFHSGVWNDKIVMAYHNISENTLEATPEEVESALTKEAERKGFENSEIMYTSMPPKRGFKCDNCGTITYKSWNG